MWSANSCLVAAAQDGQATEDTGADKRPALPAFMAPALAVLDDGSSDEDGAANEEGATITDAQDKLCKVTGAKGKVTLKKGLAKGTYKVKLKVKAAATAKYRASAAKTVTVTIKVK